jgi:hypothetical protein
VDSEDAAVMNARARNAFLEWASDPEEGPASLHPLIAKEKSEEEGAYVPTYLKVPHPASPPKMIVYYTSPFWSEEVLGGANFRTSLSALFDLLLPSHSGRNGA